MTTFYSPFDTAALALKHRFVMAPMSRNSAIAEGYIYSPGLNMSAAKAVDVELNTTQEPTAQLPALVAYCLF